MRDLLPPLVLESLRDRYVAGVADAEAHYDLHRADEDSVSGALGQSIAMRAPVVFSDGEHTYVVRIRYRKVRGRGPGAPEHRYGADGLFQIAVTDQNGCTVRQKGLPFQAKMNWRGRNKELLKQAERMEANFHSGIVVDFTPKGYSACTVQAAVASRGSRPAADRFGAIRPLGQVLGRDFLDCTIGTIGLYYDTDRATFNVDEIRPGMHVISTDITITREHPA